MAVPIQGTTPRILPSGQTGRETAEGFLRLRLEGVDDLINELLRAATKVGEDATPRLNAACKKAMREVMREYVANIPEVTGNLAKSVAVRSIENQRARGVGVAIGGPQHVVGGAGEIGKEWDVNTKGAGNHAWLFEFGTGRRRPSTQNRRTYLNVHQKINGRFRRIKNNDRQAFDNEQFERMGRGFYFIMGSRDQPTRKARQGSGYPHDFGPFAIGPNDTYGAMPANPAMEDAILASRSSVMGILTDAIRNEINKIRAA
jgi:HK97 gp10 family phage protein